MTNDLARNGGCTLAGPGRGDCAHFIGLPGESIPNQHDGADDTLDVYGKPNGWCWSCWKDQKIARAESALTIVLGWREIDWPEGFDRRTAELIAEEVRSALTLQPIILSP
jgi:hypothetical protein